MQISSNIIVNLELRFSSYRSSLLLLLSCRSLKTVSPSSKILGFRRLGDSIYVLAFTLFMVVGIYLKSHLISRTINLLI